MKRDTSLVYRTVLALGDVFAILLSFTGAFILRVTLDSRPTPIHLEALTFISTVATLTPLWIIVSYLLGLYSPAIFRYRPKEVGRLLIAAAISVLLFIAFTFFTNIPLFQAKLVAVYSFLLSFLCLFLVRSILHAIRLQLFSWGKGLQRVIIVGNGSTMTSIVDYLVDNRRSGYEVVGIVTRKKLPVTHWERLRFLSINSAIKATMPDAIIQTDEEDSSKIYALAIDHHLAYMFIPTHEALFTTRHSVDIMGGLPVISVLTTSLIGYGRIVKRIMDVIAGTVLFILALPIITIVAAIMKLTEPKAPVFFRQRRLSRFNQPVYIYKFRTMKQAFSGLSPEEAFTSIGKPELIKRYRDNGDQLDDDPRITPFGAFLRKTSLDELPQFINVLRGDISLVGPRALVPAELENYPNKNLILSVRSGLTGLAQVSGRRNIGFEERRALDVYYVQNWSVLLDLQIVLKTIYFVLTHKGAQ